MTLTIVATTPKGIVLGADSRRITLKQIYPPDFFQSNKSEGGTSAVVTKPVQKFLRMSDNITKIIPVFKNIAITCAGFGGFDKFDLSSLIKGYPKILSKDINKRRPKGHKWSVAVRKVANDLHSLFAMMLEKVEPKEVVKHLSPICLTVAGYDLLGKEDAKPECYSVTVPGSVEDGMDSSDGLGWILQGNTELAHRMKFGFSSALDSSSLALSSTKSESSTIRSGNEVIDLLDYRIRWDTISLEDATDLVAKIIELTALMGKIAESKLHKEKLNREGLPDDLPFGVGGPLNIAIIDPQKGFYWHIKKGVRQS